MTKDGALVIGIGVPSESVRKVVVFSDDAEDKGSEWSASNQGALSFAEENGNSVVVLSGWDAKTFVDKWTTIKTNATTGEEYMVKSTADYYPRVQYKYSDNNIVKGAKYTLSYKYKYMDGASVISGVSMNQIFLNIANCLTVKPDGWATYPSVGSGFAIQMYVNKAGTEGSDGWRTVAADLTLTGIETKFGAGDSLESSKIINMQAELKGFNNAGCIFDKATKAAVEANTAADGTINKNAAVDALKAEFARHDYKMYVDDFKLEVETQAVPVKVTADNAAIKVNGVKAGNGAYTYVAKDYVTAIKLAADEGYQITNVTIDGVAQDITPGAVVTVKNTFTNASEVVVATELVEMADVNATIGAGGSVKINNQSVENGNTIRLAVGTETTVAVTPDVGYKVASVTVNGVKQNVSVDGGSFKFTVDKATAINVTFRSGGVSGEVIVFKKDFEDSNISGSGFTGIE